MKRHTFLFLLRLALAAGVLYALPYSHMTWGEPYPGDGQQAFGMILVFTGIGVVFAIVYVCIGTGIQWGLRRKPAWWAMCSDLAISILLAGLLAYGGATAHYSNSDEQDGAVNGSQP
ncbi:MAG: hypothetical protein NTY19_23935 [Planctomycetota bacterium]|nr:hypothetical protein [Planctomycetota bacterium]